MAETAKWWSEKPGGNLAQPLLTNVCKRYISDGHGPYNLAPVLHLGQNYSRSVCWRSKCGHIVACAAPLLPLESANAIADMLLTTSPLGTLTSSHQCGALADLEEVANMRSHGCAVLRLG